MNCPGRTFTYLLCACMLVTVSANAQNLGHIRELAAAKQYTDARTNIELFLAQPAQASIPDAWFLKGFIYKAIAETDSIEIPLTEPRVAAFEAFKKCLELDPKNKLLKAEQYVSFFSLYNQFFGRATQYFTSGNFTGAFDYFVHAGKVQQYIYQKGFTFRGFRFTQVDTGLLLNTAISAFKAGRKTEGIVYFSRLADARIPDPQYLPVYHALVEYFISVRDEIAFHKYLNIGRQLFPYDQYWVEAEQSMIKSKGLNRALVRSYEEKLRKDPGNFQLSYTFCTELFNMLFSPGITPEETPAIQQKLEQRLEQTLALQQNGVQTELLLARYQYNNARNQPNEAGSATDSLPTTRTVLLEKAHENALTAFRFFESKPHLSRGEIENFKIAANILAGIADMLNQVDEANTYRTKITDISKMVPVRQ
ncbi:MAG: hypothetical protein JNM68_12465 [Dinghuibacter sp.]|nr:hypothetical protein [Dinghuibacter sp.]